MTSSFQSLIQQSATQHAERLALAFADHAVNHAELLDEVSRVGAGLVAMGVKAGDRVAIIAGNRLEAALVVWACAWIGAVAVPVNIRLSQGEMEAILEDCRPTALVTEVAWLALGHPTLTRIAIDPPLHSSTMSFGVLRTFSPVNAAAVDDDAPLCLIYTAATQGLPKGAIVTHGNLSASTEQIVKSWTLDARDAALGALPLFHIAGLSLYAAMLRCGGSTVLMRKFDPGQAARLVHDRRVNVIGTFSPMLEQILDSAEQAALKLTHLKAIFGLEPPAVIGRLVKLAPGAVFYASYGQTETSGLIATAPERQCPGSAGRPMHLSEVRVVDELGDPLPAGETGLIVVKGPCVSPGYWGQPVQATPISKRGWHETGDLGLLDADGTLHFRGPALKKRLIKSGGENVYPAEVEQILRACPGIADALVIGVADPEWGESVAALCVRQSDDISAEVVREFVAARIARYKSPRHIRFLAEIPKNVQGQPDLDAARRLFDEAARRPETNSGARPPADPSAEASPFAWTPSAELIAGSVLTRFMQHARTADFDTLARRADANPGWLAEQVFQFCDFRFYKPYSEILDTSRGIEHANWCVGGTTNIVLNCLDRHRGTPAWNRHFLTWEGEDGSIVRLTYAEFDEHVCRLANGLRELGVGAGDRVALYLPNIPEAFVSLFAIFKLGAIAVPLFSGFGEQPLIARLLDAEASAVLTADGSWRRGSFVPMKATLDAALQHCPGVKSVLVINRRGEHSGAALQHGRDHDWATVVAAQEPQLATIELPAEAPAVLLYTSGTTSKPKGCIWTHISFLASMALRDVHICGDFGSNDRFFFMSDMGWMVGPMSALLPAYFGASVLLAEGTPDYPRRDRFWKLVDDHEVSYLGVSPTIVRSLMRHGTEDVQKFGFDKLRITCSGGEPWNDAAWQWFFDNVCRRTKPIINLVGGTEVCGCNFVGTVHHPMLPGSFGARGLGCGVDIVDESGGPVGDNVVGELILRQPGIGMTKSLWRDDERYLETYWRILPGVWVHGDFAKRDHHGLYYVLGRSDDTIKVAGKRTGPAEIESVLTDTGKVSEAAVIGVPDSMTGSALVCVCVPMPGLEAEEKLPERLSAALISRMGPTYRPRRVVLVGDLPKTRNMKIMRRVIRAVLLKQSPGDLSALSNPESINALAQAFEAQA